MAGYGGLVANLDRDAKIAAYLVLDDSGFLFLSFYRFVLVPKTPTAAWQKAQPSHEIKESKN